MTMTKPKPARRGARPGNRNAALPGGPRLMVNVRLLPESHAWLESFKLPKTETLDGILEILRAQSITDLYTLRTLLNAECAAKDE